LGHPGRHHAGVQGIINPPRAEPLMLRIQFHS
jgi:hypothetical protein